MFFNRYDYHGTSFEQNYRCYPASFIEKPQIETGDKIIMPLSALDQLASLHIDYPMLFELRNDAAERASHCGVLEFIAEGGMIYMPYWVGSASFDDGKFAPTRRRYREGNRTQRTFLIFQTQKLCEWTAFLETTLRNYSCLTTGDSIMVAYSNKKYYIDIMETKPSNAISIIETDCEVDFAPPLDYKEPERPVVPTSSKALSQVEEAPAETELKFSTFTGTARRLDGKPLKQQSPPVSLSGSKDKGSSVSNGNNRQLSSGPSSQTTASQAQGKLVFGSNVNRPKETKQESGKQAKQEHNEKEEKPKFQPFTGGKYSLKG